ncbi:MAG: hypothetical protein KDB03_02480 [Planctomycetales bacterium]|nr:hypothetical protein [Planctomycetales bacterium]
MSRTRDRGAIVAPAVDRQQLLSDLVRRSAEYRIYSGKVLRDGDSFKLLYYPKPEEYLIEDKRLAWNDGVRALEQIAPRAVSYLRSRGAELPAAETPGASLMAWVLRDWLVGMRGSAHSITTAFDAIREAILMMDGNVLELATELYGKLLDLSGFFHRLSHSRFNIAFDPEHSPDTNQAMLEKFQASYRFDFDHLNETLAVLNGGCGNKGIRQHSVLSMHIFDTIAHQRERLLPAEKNTFADQAIDRFKTIKGLYLRLSESLSKPVSIESKVVEDIRIWREFEFDDDFSQQIKGLQWEASTIRMLVHERGGMQVASPQPVEPPAAPSNPSGQPEQKRKGGNKKKGDPRFDVNIEFILKAILTKHHKYSESIVDGHEVHGLDQTPLSLPDMIAELAESGRQIESKDTMGNYLGRLLPGKPTSKIHTHYKRLCKDTTGLYFFLRGCAGDVAELKARTNLSDDIERNLGGDDSDDEFESDN